MPSSIRTVAVLGDGPAGTTLATLLARSGVTVGLYAPGQRPEMIVGESLVPAIVPILRDLGIEEEVAGYSIYKPGATFVLSPDRTQQFDFGQVNGHLPGYAYNVPRDRLDLSLRRVCEESGAHIIHERARVEKDATGRPVLSQESLDAAKGLFGDAPDLIVDATGRTRTLARLLDLPTETGDRRDTALFAHLDSIPLVEPGHVHTDRLERGWAWRIPLPGRVSLGIVVDPGALREFGSDKETQYDTYLASEPHLKALTDGAKRISAVMKYTNYQLATQQGVGPGWALLGDAFGFVDPVFSSGLYVGMEGAQQLSKAIRSGRPAAFKRYERHVLQHLRNWQRVVSYFYDGRLFTLFAVGEQMADNPISKVVNPHAHKHLPRVFTGEAVTGQYSRRLLDFMIRYALLDNDPSELKVG
jgi:flavin-dependent dehydrogenase